MSEAPLNAKWVTLWYEDGLSLYPVAAHHASSDGDGEQPAYEGWYRWSCVRGAGFYPAPDNPKGWTPIEPEAAALIESLQAQLAKARDERDEAVNWTAIVNRHGTDGFDALGDAWLAMEGVQRMHKAVSSVFAKYASDEIMTRFREYMTTVMHQAFVEGCLVGVKAEMARAASCFLSDRGDGGG